MIAKSWNWAKQKPTWPPCTKVRNSRFTTSLSSLASTEKNPLSLSIMLVRANFSFHFSSFFFRPCTVLTHAIRSIANHTKVVEPVADGDLATTSTTGNLDLGAKTPIRSGHLDTLPPSSNDDSGPDQSAAFITELSIDP